MEKLIDDYISCKFAIVSISNLCFASLPNRLRGRLHVYDLPYDSVHDLHTKKSLRVTIILRTPIGQG
jgi:hypothetical protein